MESHLTSHTYTDRGYWEKYYRNSIVDIDQVTKIVGVYDNFWNILIQSHAGKPKTIIEIGAYPGRYLAYLSSKYHLIPTALDYNSDASKIEECFTVFGIKEYHLIQSDFLTFKPEMKYDIVISNGFVEHFEEYDAILDLHCQYLAPGGSMYIMLPNKRYLKKYYSKIVDNKNLKMHNLKIMRLDVFRNFALRNSLKIEHIGYFGGFNFSSHQKLNFAQNILYQIFRQIFKKINPFIQKHPNKFLSSSIITIYSSNSDNK